MSRKKQPTQAINRHIRSIKLGAAAALVVLVGAMMHANLPRRSSTIVDRTIKPQRVYAFEQVVSQAKTSLEQTAPNDATFVEHTFLRSRGPAALRCAQNDQNRQIQELKSTELGFKDTNVQAWFYKMTPNGSTSQHYAEHQTGYIADWANVFVNADRATMLKEYLNVSDIVDQNVAPLAKDAALTTIEQNGVQYVQLHLAFKPSANPKDQFCYPGEKAYVRLEVRTDSYKVVGYDMYLDSFADQNLVFTDHDVFTYATGVYADFTTRFVAAGFDPETAKKNTDITKLMDPKASRQK